MSPSDPTSAGELHVSITGDLSGLQATLSEAEQASAKAGQEIAQALSGGSGMLNSLVDPGHAAAEAVHEVGNSFEGLGEHLVQGAELLGVAVSLGEIAHEALDAFGHLQDLTTAFTFLTGSAEKAEEQIAVIKTMGNQLAVPMDQMEDAAQRMTVSLGKFENILPVLRDAADVSAVTHKSFESVAAAIERMALSGNAGSRQLVALGIDANRLGEAMEVTGEEATKAFKALDVSDRLDVLHTALAKTSGAAEAMAKNLTGEFTIFRNELDDSMEEIGRMIEPTVSVVLNGFADILSETRPVLAAFAELAAGSIGGAFKEFAGGAHQLADAMKLLPLDEISHGLSVVSAEIERLTGSPLSGWIRQVVGDTINYITHLRDFAQMFTLLATGIEYVTGKSSGMGVEMKKAIDNLAPAAPVLKDTSDGAKRLGDGLEEAGGKARKTADDFKLLDAAISEMAKVPQTAENALNEMAQGVNLEGLKTKLQGILDKIRDLSGVGTPEIDAFTNALANDIDKLNGFAQSGVDAIGKILAAQKKAEESAKESKLALDALAKSYEDQTPILGDHVATLAEVERAQKAYNSALAATGVTVAAATASNGAHIAALQQIAPAADLATHGIINVDEALKKQTASSAAAAQQAVTVSVELAAAKDGFYGYGVSAEQAGTKIIDFSNNIERTGEVVGSFEGASKVIVQAFQGIEAGADAVQTKIGDMVTIIDQYGVHVHTFADELAAMIDPEVSELQRIADEWAAVDRAAQAAGQSQRAANMGPQTGSQGQGQLTGNFGAAAVLQMYAAAGAPDSILDGLAKAMGLHQVGNRSYETEAEFQAQVKASDPSGVGSQALQALKDAGLSAGAAAKAMVDLEQQVNRTGRSLSALVDDYIQSLRDAAKAASDSLHQTATATGAIPWVSFKQKVDDAGNAIGSVVSGVQLFGTSVYNVNAHLEDLVQGVTNADVAFGGAVTLAGTIAQATAVVGAAAQVAAQAAGVALAALPRSSGATGVPTPFLPTASTYSIAPSGAASSGTLGSNPGGVQILVTNNAITSQDSAQRLGNTIVAALRTNAGLKL